MTINIFMYIYIGEKAKMGHICPILANQYPKIFSFFFILKCILLQISHKNVFLKMFLYSGVPGLNPICKKKQEITLS